MTDFHQSNKDFHDFCSTGVASKISNLQSVYIMYLNKLDSNAKTSKPKAAVEEAKVSGPPAALADYLKARQEREAAKNAPQ